MSRRSTAPILAAIILFSVSCTTWRVTQIVTPADYPRQNKKVMEVIKVSGEIARFSKSDPGRVRGAEIVGLATFRASERVDIPKPLRSVNKGIDGTVNLVVDRDGRAFRVGKVLSEDSGKMTVLVVDETPLWVSIPLSDVEAIRLKKVDGVTTALLGMPALAAVGFFGFFAIAMAINGGL